MVIGVTGKYCAGKSALSSLLAKRGFVVIPVDKIGHDAIVFYTDDIVKKFGTHILKKDGHINRRILGNIVFSFPEHLEWLEKKTHPWMQHKIQKIITKNSKLNFVIDAALLHYMKLHILCDTTIIVDTPQHIRFIRALRRDFLSPIRIIQRFKNQTHIPDKSYYKKRLNKPANSSEHLVSGTNTLSELDNTLTTIIQGVKDGKDVRS